MNPFIFKYYSSWKCVRKLFIFSILSHNTVYEFTASIVKVSDNYNIFLSVPSYYFFHIDQIYTSNNVDFYYVNSSLQNPLKCYSDDIRY